MIFSHTLTHGFSLSLYLFFPLASRTVFDRGEGPKTAAVELCDLALKLGSGDNTTVIVVQFFHNMTGI